MYVCTISEYVAKKELEQTSAAISDYSSAGNVRQKRKQMADLAMQLKLKTENAGGGLMSLKKKNK